ncbi:DUF4097 family beta strand repeat-containing protein [Thermaerobacter litoralis]
MAAMTSRTWPAEGIRRVEVRGGRLAVRVRPGDRLAWEAPPEVEARQEGDTLHLHSPRPRDRGWAGAALAWLGPVEEMVLTLPPTVTALTLRTTGDVELLRLALEADVHVRAGDLVAADGRGRWRIRSGAGDVTLTGHRGELDVQTGAGEVTIRDGRLDRARIRSGAGDVFFEAEVGIEAEVTTGAGSIDLRPRHRGNAVVRARSGFGSVVLDLAGVRGGRMELQTGAGSIDLAGGIHVGRRGGIGQRVVDVLGPGDGVVDITTGAGNIRVVGYGPQPWGRAAEPAAPPSPPAAPAAVPPSGPAAPSTPDAPPPPPAAPEGPPASVQPAPEGAAAFTPAVPEGSPGPALPAVGPGAQPGSSPSPYRHARDVLEALARGELTVEEADAWLRRLEEAPGA